MHTGRTPVEHLSNTVEQVEQRETYQPPLFGDVTTPALTRVQPVRQCSTDVRQTYNRVAAPKLKSKYSSICPLCSKFIAKNHSWVSALPEGIPPRCTKDRRESLDDGRAYYAEGRAITWRIYKWVHSDCLPRFDQEPKYEEIVIAEGWSNLVLRRPTERDTYLYRFFDRVGRLLYVGITFDMDKRFGQHAREKPMHLVHRIQWELFDTREDARSAERTAICFEDPVWNIVT
jgi:hypothetical protein